MKPFAAFIRAIGPETHRVMPLAKLCEACVGLGLVGAKSHIASGNLLFHSSWEAAHAARLVEQAISQFGLRCPVFIREAGDLETIISGNPFPDAAQDRPSRLSISLFDEDQEPELAAALMAWPGPERIVVRARCVYVDYTAGQGTSKIAPPVLERRLKRTGTARNWNTIVKMRALLAGM